MEIALTGDKALTQPHLHGALDTPLVYVPVIRDKQVPDKVGVIKEVGLERPSGEKGDIAVIAGRRGHQAQGITYE